MAQTSDDVVEFNIQNPHPKRIVEISERAFDYINKLNKSSKILADFKAQRALAFLLNYAINDEPIANLSLK